jgi:hypothetical protein
MTVTDGRARQLDVVGVGSDQLFKLFLGDHLFKRHERDVVTESPAEIGGDVVHQRLIDGGEDAALQQQRHDVLRLDAELLGETLSRSSLRSGARLSVRRTGHFQPAGDAVFERQRLRRRNEIALVEPAGLPSIFRPPRGLLRRERRRPASEVECR